MRNSDSRISPAELRTARGLAGIFALRMLGLFMILPVLSLYIDQLMGATPLLVGLAIGVYGLTQALFQIPLGMLSDRVGRKPVITAGLLVFALGSVVAAMADSIYGVIAGRALQGSGAIAAAVMAMAADLTREDQRLKVMAIIGMSIGVAFALALVVGPILNAWVGLSGIFWLTALLALAAAGILRWRLPTPVRSALHRDTETVPTQLRRIVLDTQLLRLDIGILVLHMVLTANFFAIPLVLRDHAGLPPAQHWHLYLPVLLLSMAAILPFVVVAERRRQMKQTLVGAVACLLVAELLLATVPSGIWAIAAVLWVYFLAFNLLEALLPSMIAKLAPAAGKGTAMGVYSSAQFVGAFIGGLMGGVVYGAVGEAGVFLLSAAVVAGWLVLATTMRPPRYLSSMVLRMGPQIGTTPELLSARIAQVTGVAEVVVIPEEEVAYLKVDGAVLDRDALNALIAAPVNTSTVPTG
jgi:MFS family permease